MRRRPGYLGQADILKPRDNRSSVATQDTHQAIKNLMAPASTLDKASKKADFPPGLVVSESAKTSMALKKQEIDRKEAEKAEVVRVQGQRWVNRPDVLAKWLAQEQKFLAKKQAILDKWAVKEAQRAAHRKVLIDKLAAQGAAPATLEAQNAKLAQEDTVEALQKADELAHCETECLNETVAREKAQVRNDKFYNLFAGLLGWQKRQIPV